MDPVAERVARQRALLLLHVSAPRPARLEQADRAMRLAAQHCDASQLLPAWLLHAADLGPARAAMWRPVLEARVVAELLDGRQPAAVLHLALLLGTSSYGAPLADAGLTRTAPAVAETLTGTDAVAQRLAVLMGPDVAAAAASAVRTAHPSEVSALLDAQARGARRWAVAAARTRALQAEVRRHGRCGAAMRATIARLADFVRAPDRWGSGGDAGPGHR